MAPYAPPRKRSVLIAGHQTSISLEPMFWQALEDAARERGCPLNALVADEADFITGSTLSVNGGQHMY